MLPANVQDELLSMDDDFVMFEVKVLDCKKVSCPTCLQPQQRLVKKWRWFAGAVAVVSPIPSAVVGL